jgi:hypothetical protein
VPAVVPPTPLTTPTLPAAPAVDPPNSAGLSRTACTDRHLIADSGHVGAHLNHIAPEPYLRAISASNVAVTQMLAKTIAVQTKSRPLGISRPTVF